MTEDDKKTLSALNAEETRSKIKIYTAANHFATGLTRMNTIARRIGVSTKQLTLWVNTPEWEEALRFWGAEGEKLKGKPKITDNTPHTLREDYLILKAFQKENSPVRFVTYDGIIDKPVKEIWAYQYVFDDDTTLPKIETLLVFQKRHMPSVKLGIKRRKGVAVMNLQPIKRRQDRTKVVINARLGSHVECIMRNGLVVTGELIWKGRYNLVMRIGDGFTRGKVVIVYRHGIYAFTVMGSKARTDVESNDEWEDEIRIIATVDNEDRDVIIRKE